MATVRLTRLKIKLIEADKRQYQIAAACGMHPSTLSQYSLGQSQMSIAHLRALARYFDCRQQDILGFDETEWEVG